MNSHAQATTNHTPGAPAHRRGLQLPDRRLGVRRPLRSFPFQPLFPKADSRNKLEKRTQERADAGVNSLGAPLVKDF